MRHVPGAWHFAILALAAYRLVRLIGWDDFPPIARARGWLIGEHWIPDEGVDGEVGLPGKQPSSEVSRVRPAYGRPMHAHFVHCPFCLGFWVSVAVWAAWLGDGRATLIACTPFALGAVVGLVAKNLDP